MKQFITKIFDKIVQNRTYALLVSVLLFVAILVGIPFLTADKTIEEPQNVNQTTIENTKTFTGSTKVSNETDISIASESDITEVVEIEESTLEEVIDEIAYNPPISDNYQESSNTATNNPNDSSAIESQIENEYEEIVIDTPVDIDESEPWEESQYEYTDETINVDFGDKDADDNTTKVVYEAPVWVDENGELFTSVSNWLDRVTNQDLKKIEFALVDAYDSRVQDSPEIDLPISDFQSSFWNQIKNFFVRIYQDNTNNIILTEEEGNDIIINQSVLNNVNVKYQIIANKGIKEEIVVVNDSDVNDSYIFTLKLDDGVQYRINSNNEIDAPADVYYFTDQMGQYIAHFVPLIAEDMAGNKTEDITMNIERLYGNDHKITITVDPDWMYSEDRVYPIVIDPSIIHNEQPIIDDNDTDPADTTNDNTSSDTDDADSDDTCDNSDECDLTTVSQEDDLTSTATVTDPIIDLGNEDDLTLAISLTPSFDTPITDGSIKLIFNDEFDLSGITPADISVSGSNVEWSDDEEIYSNGSLVALDKPWFTEIAHAQGSSSITFDFVGDISSVNGIITFIITGVTPPSPPPTTGTYTFIVQWYDNNYPGGSPLYVQNSKVYFYSDTTVTATVPTSFTFFINPVASGTVNSANITTSTTTGAAASFGSYTSAENRIASHDLLVSTNSTNGYVVTTQYSGAFQSSGSDILDNFTGSNTTPTTWATPPGSGTEAYFGYTTNDSSLLSSATDRFTSSGGNKWAAFTTTPNEVAYSAIPITNETTRVGYRLEITNLQPAGIYSTNVMYIATPTF